LKVGTEMRKLEERLADLEEERTALVEKHEAAVRQRENLASEAAVLRKKLQEALQEGVPQIPEGKDQQQEVDSLKKQLDKALEVYKPPVRVKKEERPVAGPPGSIKAERTFPTIVPDPSVNPELAKVGHGQLAVTVICSQAQLGLPDQVVKRDRANAFTKRGEWKRKPGFCRSRHGEFLFSTEISSLRC
jgi:hypothetical protein